MSMSFNQTVTRAVIGVVGTAFCAGLCLVAATAPAYAATADSPRTATVSYSDLDLNHASGRAVLDRRIHNAARSVCSLGGEPALRAAEARCVRDARRNAQSKVVAPVDVAIAG